MVILGTVMMLFIQGLSYGDIKDGLVSAWALDEGSGTYTGDKVGNNHGVLIAGDATDELPTWITPGKLGGAHLDFTSGTATGTTISQAVLFNSDGETDSHEIPADLMPTAAITVSAWAKIDNFGYYGGVFYNAMWTGGKKSGYMMHTDKGAFNWWVKGSSDYALVSLPGDTGQWYHLAGTFDSALGSNQLKLYANGILVGTADLAGTIDWDPVPYNCMIGAYNDDNENLELNGEVDDVGVWNRALTQEEVQWLYNSGNAIPGQPLIPTPANGTELIPVDQVLSWEVGWEEIEALGYDVYFGTDSDVTANEKVVDNELVNSHDPFGEEDLEFETTYYWRVDIHEANEPGEPWLHEGKVWQFITSPAEVIIMQQPGNQVVELGGTAQFSVEALNDVGWAWYKEGDPDEILVSDGVKIIGAETDALTITDVQISDEGNYYCILKDIDDAETPSASAILMRERLVGHWSFDGDTLDYSGLDNHGTDVGDPEFVAGLIGSEAVELDGDDYVTMDGAADDILIDDVTMSAWVKTTDSYAAWYSCNTANYGNVVLWVINGGRAAVWVNDHEAYSATMVSDDTWHMLTYSRIGSTGYIYVDGTLEDTHSANFRFSPDNRWSIGQEWDWDDDDEVVETSEFLAGQVDDARLYNYGLDKYEVAELYRETRPDEWICTDPPVMDMDDDCIVSINDFVVIARSWLECNIVPTCIQ